MGEHLYRLLCSYGFPPLHWQYNPNKKFTHQRTYLAQNRKLLCMCVGGWDSENHIFIRGLLRFSLPCLHPFWHLTWETLTWGFKHWALSITVDPRLWGTSAGWARLNFFFFLTPCTSLFAPERVIIAAQALSIHPPPPPLPTHTRGVGSLIVVITIQAFKHPLNIINSQFFHCVSVSVCVCVCVCVCARVCVCVSVYLRGK